MLNKVNSYLLTSCSFRVILFLLLISTESKNDISVDLEACEAPPVAGPCRGGFKRYYFNPNSQKCESFIYGGKYYWTHLFYCHDCT